MVLQQCLWQHKLVVAIAMLLLIITLSCHEHFAHVTEPVIMPGGGGGGGGRWEGTLVSQMAIDRL